MPDHCDHQGKATPGADTNPQIPLEDDGRGIANAFEACLLLDHTHASGSLITTALRQLANHARSSEAAILFPSSNALDLLHCSCGEGTTFQGGGALREFITPCSNIRQVDLGTDHPSGFGRALLVPMHPFMEGALLALFRRPSEPAWTPGQTHLVGIAMKVLSHALGRATRAQPNGVYTHTVHLPNHLALVPAVADYFVNRALPWLPAGDDGMGLKIGLVELINNAIEHGNLGITSSEKEEALATPGSYDALIHHRQGDPQRSTRMVQVSMALNSNSIEWHVMDEGDGFDWQGAFSDQATDVPNLVDLSGRGIFLCRHCFDEFNYIDRGNNVRACKYIGH